MWAQVRAKIAEVADTAASVAVVYAYPTSTEDDYPAVSVLGAENESEFGNGAPSNANVQTVVFTVRVLYTVSDENQQEAEEKIDTVLDELMALFSNPNSLSPACDWVEPASASWAYQDRGNGLVRIADIKLRCRKLQ